jgi:uncharacterized protein YbaP (TraB family)
MSRLALAALAAIAALSAASAAQALPALWTVRDADSEMVLFGSIHILPSRLAWRPPALDTALATADDLWMEIPSDRSSQQAAMALVAPRAYLPEGQTLDAKLTRTGRRRLAEAVKRLGLPMAAVQRMRPWMAELTLSSADALRRGATGEGGVEQVLLADPRRPARVTAFETVEQQAELFAGAPEPQQLRSLENTLRDLRDTPDGYGRLVAAWMSGDIGALQREAVDPLRRREPDTFRRLVTDRNNAWLPQIRQRLSGSGRTVVVVGSGHLIGPEGLPARLRALGYRVEGP